MRIKIFCMDLVNNRSLLCRLLLLIGWVLGILLGCLSSRFLSDVASLMHTLMYSGMSIVGGLAVCFLPLLITAIILWFKKVWLLIALAFTKAFLFGAASGIIMQAFRHAGWLLRCLFLFSDSVLSVLYVHLWFTIIKDRTDSKKALLHTAIYCSAVFIIDYFVVAPFTAMLF